jgi:hypothetical protein
MRENLEFYFSKYNLTGVHLGGNIVVIPEYLTITASLIGDLSEKNVSYSTLYLYQ